MILEILGSDEFTFKVEINKNHFYVNKEDIEEFTEKLELLIDEYKKELY